MFPSLYESIKTGETMTSNRYILEARNAPSSSLGNYSIHDLRMYVDHYAEELKLKKQPVIPGDPGYAPWSPEQK